MTKLAKIIIWASVMTLLLSFQAMAAQSLRVASSVDEIETPIMQCSQNGTRSTAMKIDIKGYSDSQVRIAGQTFNKVELAEREKLTVGTTGEVGKPELPLYTTNLAIPNYKSVNVRVNYSSYEIFENYDIAPVQQFQVEGEEQSFSTIIGEGLIDPQAYNTDAFYPEEIVSVGDPMILRDFRMAMVTVAPVQYNPATRQLKVYTDIDFDVVYEGEDFSNPAPVKRDFISDAFKPLYQSIFANFDQVCSDLPSKRGGYMIITHDAFYDSLAEFAEWKHQKGYDVKIVKLSDIRSNPTSYHIDTFIDTCYTNWEIPPEYILLVGDVSMPNSKYFPDYSYSGYTSDHEYSCVDGDDYIPDIFISRWAIDTDRELHWVMRKTITYETDPQEISDGWLRRGLSVAGNWYANTPRLTTLWVRQKLIDNNYTLVDTCFDWSEGGHQQCNEQVIRNAMNDGVNVIAYRGWAYASGWAQPYFRVNDLNNLSNDYRGGIMTSIVCGTGDYGDNGTDPCFGEAWIRGGSTSAPRGGIAFYGTTDHSTHTAWNNPIMIGFYWGLFDEGLTHFGQSVVRSKLFQYACLDGYNDYDDYNGPVSKYFYTYNALGDPEVNVWRTPPGTMNITYDNDITTASNYVTVEVKDSERNPLEGAYVTAIKTVGGEDEIFSVSKSDASGNVLLPFDTNPTTGDMSLTVTHRDFIPHRGSIHVGQATVSIGYMSHIIDDDNYGASQGNDNGEANPAEYIEVSISVMNSGSGNANNVSGVMIIDNEYGKVLTGTRTFGSIPAGGNAQSAGDYVVMVSPDCPDGYLLPFEIAITADGTDEVMSVAEIMVNSPTLTVTGITIDDAGGNNNGLLDPGETANVILDVQNNGNEDAIELNGILDTGDAYLTITDIDGSFGDIPEGQARNNSGNPFTITADSDIFEGRKCQLMMTVSNSAGMSSEVPFTIEIGEISADDPVGPDDYGYYIYDNTDTDYSIVPTYEWVGIEDSGTRVANGDDETDIAFIPFDFVYYGNVYRHITICSNGFAALDTAVVDQGGNHWALFFNWPMPDPGGPGGMIAPFWDDLNGGSGTGIFYDYDTENHRFIISWDHIRTAWYSGSAYESFEIIIYDANYYPTVTGDCRIEFMYEDISDSDGDENYSTVGFESFDEHDGLEYVFCRYYDDGAASLVDGRSLLITTNTGRGRVNGQATLSDNSDNSGIMAMTSTGQRGYTGYGGSYFIKDAEVDNVDIQFSNKGYYPALLTGINVAANMPTDADAVTLNPAPVPTNLSATEGDDDVVITWDEADPSAIGYDVYRSRYQNGLYRKLNDNPVTGLSYTDSDVMPGRLYWYYTEAVYEDAISFASNKDSGVSGQVDVDENDESLPKHYSLNQNYPNPFNPTTVIDYALPTDCDVNLSVYNVMGQRVVTLVNENKNAGYHSIAWDGHTGSGAKVSSGIYFYRLDTKDFSKVRRMMLLK